MVKVLTRQLTNDVGALLGGGQCPEEIAKTLNISRASVCRIRKNLKDYGVPRRPSYKTRGRPKKLSTEQEEVG
jgi:transposase